MSDNKFTAQAVFERAFTPGREARSEAYKRGVLHALQVRIDGSLPTPSPYAPGTAEADAFHAGVEEGRALSPVGGSPDGVE